MSNAFLRDIILYGYYVIVYINVKRKLKVFSYHIVRKNVVPGNGSHSLHIFSLS